MVRIYEEDVYELLTDNWKSGRKLKRELSEKLGLTDLTTKQKLRYLVNFQTPSISSANFHSRLASLVREGFVHRLIRYKDVDGEEVRVPHYKRADSRKTKLHPMRGLQFAFSPV